MMQDRERKTERETVCVRERETDHDLFALLGHQLLRLGDRIRERLVAHPGQEARRHPSRDGDNTVVVSTLSALFQRLLSQPCCLKVVVATLSAPAVHGYALKVPIEHGRDRNPTTQTPLDAFSLAQLCARHSQTERPHVVPRRAPAD